MVNATLRAMLRVFFGLALLLACEGAGAQNVVGATTATIEWMSASGPVAGYGVYIARNGTPYPSSPTITTASTTAQVSGAYGDTLTVKVAAYNAAGSFGPFSLDSAPIRFVPGPSIALSTTSVSASTLSGSSPANTSFTVRNSGAGTLNYTVSSNQSWVSVSPTGGTNTGATDPITVSFATSRLAVGNYSAQLTVYASGAGSQTITVHLAVTSSSGTPPPPSGNPPPPSGNPPPPSGNPPPPSGSPPPPSTSTASGLSVFSTKSGQWIFVGASNGLDSSFGFGGAGYIPVYGDWNGDGVATVGAFDPATATWYLRNEPGPGMPDLVFQFGPAGSVPVVGDWDGNGTTTIGVFDPGSARWYLRNSNSAGAADLSFQYGWPGAIPVVGDWNGDKVDTVGVYYPPTGQWLLRNSPGGGGADLVFTFGYAGTQPVVGNWSGSGVDGVGIFDPTTGTWYLRDTASGGVPDHEVISPNALGMVSVSMPGLSHDLPGGSTLSASSGDQLGLFDPGTGDWTLQYGHASNSPFSSFTYGGANFIPLYGDWNGDGVATLGVFDPSTATFYLRNTPGPGPAEVVFQFGPAGSIPVVGDWDGNGTTTVGVFVPSSAQWYLRNSNSAGAPDLSFQFGWPGAIPVAGDWNGNKVDTVGVFDPSSAQWLLRNNPAAGAADLVFTYGYRGSQPLVGDWTHSGHDGIGIYDPSSGLFMLRNTATAGLPDLSTTIGGGMSGGTALVWTP
jgi:hypothetical protein